MHKDPHYQAHIPLTTLRVPAVYIPTGTLRVPPAGAHPLSTILSTSHSTKIITVQTPSGRWTSRHLKYFYLKDKSKN
jgi:hypothetical protein